jgi:preprotein translocase subunit SecE
MKKFFENRLTDIKESYNELVHKVSWPTKSELANSTIVVMVASIIAALVIWVIDLCIDQIMHLVYGVAA